MILHVRLLVAATAPIDWYPFWICQCAVYLAYWLLVWRLVIPQPPQSRAGLAFQLILVAYILVQSFLFDIFFGGAVTVEHFLLGIAIASGAAIPVWKLFPKRAKQK